MVEAPSALRNSARLPIKVSATRVVVTVVPTFAPRMIGMAPRIGNAPAPTAVTAMAVVVVDDWIKTVPSTPTLSPTQEFGPYRKLDTSCVQRVGGGRSHGHRAAGGRGLPRGVTFSGAVVRITIG